MEGKNFHEPLESQTMPMNNLHHVSTQLQMGVECKNVPIFRSSPHHGKPARGGPRDDGFRSGICVVSTYTSEPPAEWK